MAPTPAAAAVRRAARHAAARRQLPDDESHGEFVEVVQRGDARGIKIPHDRASVPRVRTYFQDEIEGSVPPEVASDAALVVSELVANAVLHAAAIDGSIMLRWQVRQGTIDVEVTDGGPLPGDTAPVRPLRPGVYSSHGRGLRIVRSLAHEWGVLEHEDARRTVWAALGGPSRRRHSIP